jgi:hypothetical protein
MSELPPLRLLMFAPCERVIIAEEGDHSSSLIAVLQGFTINPADLPPKVVQSQDGEKASVPVLPIPWHIFTLWENDGSGRTFRQRFEFLSPTGKVLIAGKAEFTLDKDKRFHRITGRLQGIPVDGFGDYLLVLALQTGDGEFVERARFPIPITPQEPK